MRKYIIPAEDFIFDASLKTITFGRDIILEEVFTIANVTDGIVIFRYGCENETGTVNRQVLTLDYNTTAMSDNDALLVVFIENEDLTDVIERTSRTEDSTLNEILTELQTANKYLQKIYNPE
jgi:hypothetical protein